MGTTAANMARRTNPKEYVSFVKPLTGPTGAELIGYEWQWKPFEFIDSRGEERIRRISNWEQSVPSGETGREIVHQFVVMTHEGTHQKVSAESAIRLLGFDGTESIRQFKSLASSAKTLARLRMELAETQSAYDAWLKDKVNVDALPLPDILRLGIWWHMGDAMVVQREDVPILAERKQCLIDSWHGNRMFERGWRMYLPFLNRISDLQYRLKRIEKKLALSSTDTKAA